MSSRGRVAGVDACKGGWVAIVLDDHAFVDALRVATISDLLESLTDVSALAVDIPIGIDGPYPRRADVAAREFVEDRRSSVFMTPPRAVLATPDHEQASRLARETIGTGVSRQAFALAPKILEVDAVARSESRIIEAHPEVSFRAMAGQPLLHSKKSWNGMKLREQLLVKAGITIPSELAIPWSVAVDDVLDAAAAAWWLFVMPRVRRSLFQRPQDPTNPSSGTERPP